MVIINIMGQVGLKHTEGSSFDPVDLRILGISEPLIYH